MNITAIIQARMGSTRLPGKVLMPLAGKPVLQHIVERVNRSKYLEDLANIVVTTPINRLKGRIEIIDSLHENNIRCSWFGGDENDVLKRIYDTAKFHNSDIIVDITGDCPLIDPNHIDFLIEKLLNEKLKYDCTTNCMKRTFADGFDIIVYPFSTLNSINKWVREKELRTHAGWNIFQYDRIFDIYNWEAVGFMRKPELRLTLDTEADYIVLQRIFEHFEKIGKGNNFTADEVMFYIKENPGIITNQHVKGKEPGE